MILVTGGAGFIGANFIRDWLARCDEPVLNLDSLSYASNRASLQSLAGDARHVFVHGDICDRALVDGLLATHRPRALVHFAAETHVDRSIDDPGAFIRSNVQGTFTLLEAVRAYWSGLACEERVQFRFHHISTDEVYGSLAPGEAPFTETHPYRPNSPYAASKAASDHLVRAWHHTYGLPTLITNCSNNYGPGQFPEKLIPLVITQALAGKALPVYGDGLQVRDWLFVGDHCAAIREVLARGRVGQTYNLGGNCEKPNLEIVRELCALLDELRPREDGGSYSAQIAFVTDRPGHDRRYAINSHKVESELGWRPVESLGSGLRKTVEWFLAASSSGRRPHPNPLPEGEGTKRNSRALHDDRLMPPPRREGLLLPIPKRDDLLLPLPQGDDLLLPLPLAGEGGGEGVGAPSSIPKRRVPKSPKP